MHSYIRLCRHHWHRHIVHSTNNSIRSGHLCTCWCRHLHCLDCHRHRLIWADDAVAAPRIPTCIGACIGVYIIFIVTLFSIIHDAIAAEFFYGTHCRTSVTVFNIAVITAFIRSNDTVSTACVLTGIRTGIGIHIVAIITLFVGSNDRIAAASGSTCIRTGVCVHIVAVIALFIGTDYTVTASCILTEIRAGVCVHIISIIACFPRVDLAVTTAR